MEIYFVSLVILMDDDDGRWMMMMMEDGWTMMENGKSQKIIYKKHIFQSCRGCSGEHRRGTNGPPKIR